MIIVALILILWMLSGIAGAVLWGTRGFGWGLTLGLIGLAICHAKVERERREAEARALADARIRERVRRRSEPKPQAIRWPD